MSRKILIVELWGLGDLTFAIPMIRAAIDRGDEVHIVGKGHARELLEPTFPGLNFITYEAPWTAYTGKYRFWKWKWAELFGLLRKLRGNKYDVSVSVRNDPRDQVLMRLIAARERVGFKLSGTKRKHFDLGRLTLTRRLKRPNVKQHKVEDWQQVASALDMPGHESEKPLLDHGRYHTAQVDRFFSNATKPVVCLHTGARIGVRRWPEKYFAAVIAEMRKRFQFHLIVIPEPQTPPSSLMEIADVFVTNLSVRELVDVLGRVDLLLCNDSGPAHIASSCGRPVIAIFGPSDADWFRPWGDEAKVVMRDICQWRPCFDYCKFSEPHCMTKLTPEIVWPDIEQQIRMLVTTGKLSPDLVNERAHAATDV